VLSDVAAIWSVWFLLLVRKRGDSWLYAAEVETRVGVPRSTSSARLSPRLQQRRSNVDYNNYMYGRHGQVPGEGKHEAVSCRSATSLGCHSFSPEPLSRHFEWCGREQPDATDRSISLCMSGCYTSAGRLAHAWIEYPKRHGDLPNGHTPGPRISLPSIKASELEATMLA
jgi:hypothetical protein